MTLLEYMRKSSADPLGKPSRIYEGVSVASYEEWESVATAAGHTVPSDAPRGGLRRTYQVLRVALVTPA